jgi:hypothetical protein
MGNECGYISTAEYLLSVLPVLGMVAVYVFAVAITEAGETHRQEQRRKYRQSRRFQSLVYPEKTMSKGMNGHSSSYP